MRHAFSLFELVLTMVIIGITTAVAVPRVISAQTANRLDAAESRLTAEFLAAGELAQARARNLTIQIDPATHQFRIFEGQGAARSTLISSVDFSEPPYEVEILSTNITDADGYLGVSGFGVFDAAAKVSIRAGTITRTINLQGPTKGVLPTEEEAAEAGGGGGSGLLGLGILGL